MIREVKVPSKYGNYFLAREAPGDEETPKRNTKVIEIKAKNRLRNDFTDGAEEPSEEVEPMENNMDTNEETPVPDESPDMSGEETDFTSDDPEPVADTGSDTPDTGTNIEDDVSNTTAEIDANNNIDFTSDVEMDNDSTEGEGEETTDEPDLGTGEEDFTSDNPDDGSTGEDMDTSTDSGGETEQKGPGLEYDSTRKYMLFINYSDLLNAIDNYIDKLENARNDDINFNVTIKTVMDKLREIRSLCYDYMTMKFEVSTYFQSLLFYQNIVVLIQLSFNLLDKAVKTLKTKE